MAGFRGDESGDRAQLLTLNGVKAPDGFIKL